MGQLLDLCSPIQNVLIRGTLTYSRVYRKIEGEELRIQNEKRRARGSNVLFNSPYYVVVLENPAIINAQQLPPEVVDFFTSKIRTYQYPDGTSSRKYYAMSKSKYAPVISYSDEAGAGEADGTDIELREELDTGMDVTLCACIYKAGIGKGVGFDRILLNEPVRYYSCNFETIASMRESRPWQGIVFKNENIS